MLRCRYRDPITQALKWYRTNPLGVQFGQTGQTKPDLKQGASACVEVIKERRLDNTTWLETLTETLGVSMRPRTRKQMLYERKRARLILNYVFEKCQLKQDVKSPEMTFEEQEAWLKPKERPTKVEMWRPKAHKYKKKSKKVKKTKKRRVEPIEDVADSEDEEEEEGVEDPSPRRRVKKTLAMTQVKPERQARSPGSQSAGEV